MTTSEFQLFLKLNRGQSQLEFILKKLKKTAKNEIGKQHIILVNVLNFV